MFISRSAVRVQLAALFVFLFVFSTAAQSGQSIVLSWDPSPDPTVVGYIVYYGTSSGDYTMQDDVGTNTTATITNLQPGLTYYFVVVDYNALGVQSPPSGEISITIPGLFLQPNSWGGMLVTFPVAPSNNYVLQTSTNLQSWTTVWQTNSATNSTVQFVDLTTASTPQKFYRVLVYTPPPQQPAQQPAVPAKKSLDALTR